jgi:dienelactone hydrolase
MPGGRVGAAVLCSWVPLAAGCIPALPDNIDDAAFPPSRTVFLERDGAVFSMEDGSESAIWLEIDRPDGSGRVGGYLSLSDGDRRSLVLFLPGASTYDASGGLQAAHDFHTIFGQPFQEAGYSIWTLLTRECGTAYGQDDLTDVLAAVDWLGDKGKAALGADRVYMVGYSKGATLAILVNQQRDLTALVSLAGLTQPDQLESGWLLYSLVADLYPSNVGICQLGTTLETYGRPGDPGWDALDSVSRIGEFRRPMLFIHGTVDQIYYTYNTTAMQDRYDAGLAAGQTLADLEFWFVEGADHFAMRDDPVIRQKTLEYFAEFEPAAQAPGS